MKTHVKVALFAASLGLLAMLGVKGYQLWESPRQQLDVTDAKNTKGIVRLAMDGWIGYFPLCSAQMAARLRRQGYLLQCIDDQANYKERFSKLGRGEYSFAVGTVDSYIKNGQSIGYTTPIIAVIDESKGGDAIVAHKKRIASLEDIKQLSNVKVAYTADSPSEHLLRAVRSHFDILPLHQASQWQVQADGSSEALDLLLADKVDIAVLWEPEVTRALTHPEITRLLGSEDTRKLIVDVLLASPQVLKQTPDLPQIFLDAYFQTLRHYRGNHTELVQELHSKLDLSTPQIEQLLAGVEWKSLTDNVEYWFGSGNSGHLREDLFDTIEAALLLLREDGVFKNNPIPNQDPFRLMNSEPVTQLHSVFASTALTTLPDDSPGTFRPLTAADWSHLKPVGTLKTRPISFSSGAAHLTQEGREQIDMLVQSLQHYPNYRVEIRGHTAGKGDAQANKALSQARTDTVHAYILNQHGENPNRYRAIGFGADKPLPRQQNESLRAYNYRLPRVELVLLNGEI